MSLAVLFSWLDEGASRDFLDESEPFLCVCVLRAIVIVCACVGRILYVRASDGFSLNETSWAMSAMVLVWKLPVLLITIGMICTCSRSLLRYSLACLSGS
jgi:hypothetical protein